MKYKINITESGTVEYPIHTHKNYEIMLYLEGSGCMRTELGDIPVEPGTIIIVPPNIKHGTRSDNGFKNISVEGEFDSYFHFGAVKHFNDNESREGSKLARMIYDNRFGNEAYLSSLCTSYVYFIMQRIESDQSLQKVVRKIVFDISEQALDSEIDLTRILSNSGYSEDYIRSCFKRITGKTPNSFLTDLRIKHACFLIDIYREEMSLIEISERCGYLDYVYFSKKFKSVMGMSPRDYKKQNNITPISDEEE